MKRCDLGREIKKELPWKVRKYVDLMLILAFKNISKSLLNNEKVTIYNFGEFYIKQSKVRTVYDFKSKRRVPHIGNYKIKFKASPAIEKRVQNPST